MKKLIIVLAHPRTGSSLLMQTLKLLNVAVIGQFERNDLPQHANPKGYFEDMHILSKGITEETIEKIEQSESEIVAFKIALAVMVEDKRVSHWQYLKEKQATILVPIRPPLESAVSNLVFNRNNNDLVHFRRITSFLRNYCLQYKSLSDILLSTVPQLLSNCFMINYHQALNNPQKYMQSIIDVVGLTVSESKFNDALKNIDSKLYRYNQSLLEEYVKNWNRIIGADRIYNILSTQKKPWEIINGLEDKE